MRRKYLERLVGREAKLWSEVEASFAAGTAKECDSGVNRLKDLRDLAVLRADDEAFALHLDELRQHSALIRRLDAAGLR